MDIGSTSASNSPVASGTHVSQVVNYYQPLQAASLPIISTPAPAIVYSSTPTPTEIHSLIYSLPPFQRESACKNYEGLHVRWTVRLSKIESTNFSGLYDVVATSGQGLAVVFVIKISENPRLKIMHPGETFDVSGTIEKLTPAFRLHTRLKNVLLDFRQGSQEQRPADTPPAV